MQFHVTQGDLVQQPVDCLVINLFEGVSEPGGATGAVDQALDGAIRTLIASDDFVGKAGTTALLYTNGKIPAARVLIVGLGQTEKFDAQRVRKAAATAHKALKKLKGAQHYATVIHGAGLAGLDARSAAQAVAEGAVLACYQAPNYKREQPEAGPQQCTVVESDGAKVDAISAGLRAGQSLAEAVCHARDYVSEPPNVLYPEEFARRAQAMAAAVGLTFSVLDEAAMRALGMNILLAVSLGSEREAQLIILEHAPANTQDQPPLVLVGKGITFDTGGISIKPSEGMWLMKDDMGGAAAVVGAMEAIARLNIERRVIGVAVCVENMPDGKAFRPGDILTGITGKSTEIFSTDAEGRLVLADALGYVARYNPMAVVDLATLTGAIGVALGSQAAGLFANDDNVQAGLLASAGRTGERLWPMPMYDEYMDAIKSDMAEVKNSGGRAGGVATSAKFIEHFTEGYPWAHLDIAAMVWTDQEKAPATPKGATGYGVRLLVDFVQTFGTA
ncbi:MAG: leucyl aminopeptidase [Chloroflexota bacterium]|nr:leucyl aminopeptidase [Chloroflexota bacterium]